MAATHEVGVDELQPSSALTDAEFAFMYELFRDLTRESGTKITLEVPNAATYGLDPYQLLPYYDVSTPHYQLIKYDPDTRLSVRITKFAVSPPSSNQPAKLHRLRVKEQDRELPDLTVAELTDIRSVMQTLADRLPSRKVA